MGTCDENHVWVAAPVKQAIPAADQGFSGTFASAERRACQRSQFRCPFSQNPGARLPTSKTHAVSRRSEPYQIGRNENRMFTPMPVQTRSFSSQQMGP